MAEDQSDRPLAPRRSLGGPVLPPPPPELQEQARKQEADQAAAQQARERKEAEKAARAQEKAAQKESARQAREDAKQQKAAAASQAAQKAEADKVEAQKREAQRAQATPSPAASSPAPATTPIGAPPVSSGPTARPPSSTGGRPAKKSSGRSRRARLRLVQIDAWSVMKTSFLLSIALGIVLVVAVGIIMSVLGAAGVWDSINSIVQQAVGSDSGQRFDIQQYVGPSRVLGFTMIVAVVDVILITAISTLGAFLYNLSAALLGGIEVTLAEDS